MEIGTLQSLNPSKSNSFPISTTRITLGRSPTCTIVLSDLRCSGLHCGISIKENSEFIIEDFSSNGTFLNGSLVIYKQIGRNNTAIAKWNDRIDILQESEKVEHGSGISYQLIPCMKRKQNLDSSPEKLIKQSTDNIEEEITCLVCMEILENPLSLYPCLHNFCEACYLDWKQRSKECPVCREVVLEVRQSQMLQKLVEIYLDSRPEMKRISAKCRQCLENSEDFKCPANQKHISCEKCKVLMPERKDFPQQCLKCKNYYCNKYFSDCKSGIDFLENYAREVSVTPGLFKNTFEENVLSDYLQMNKVQSADLYLCGLDRDLLKGSLKSLICESCSPKIWADSLWEYRKIVFENLPISYQTRPRCPKSTGCLLQYSVLHSQIYNHI